jgi:RNA polymerase sigma-70 factor (ECF subfamily)
MPAMPLRLVGESAITRFPNLEHDDDDQADHRHDHRPANHLWLRQGRALYLHGDLRVQGLQVQDLWAMTDPDPNLAELVASHREFLAFVQRRVGDRALAEEIVQDALVRSVDRVGEIRESAVGWFYRVLRNAIIDRARRAKVQRDRADALAAELASEAESTDEELHRVVCRCVTALAATLKPEYAEALQRIDVDGVAVKDYADAAGISASNAGVRVFRARQALRTQVARACGTCATHGCLDCTCDSAPHGHHA